MGMERWSVMLLPGPACSLPTGNLSHSRSACKNTASI